MINNDGRSEENDGNDGAVHDILCLFLASYLYLQFSTSYSCLEQFLLPVDSCILLDLLSYFYFLISTDYLDFNTTHKKLAELICGTMLSNQMVT